MWFLICLYGLRVVKILIIIVVSLRIVFISVLIGLVIVVNVDFVVVSVEIINFVILVRFEVRESELVVIVGLFLFLMVFVSC